MCLHTDLLPEGRRGPDGCRLSNKVQILEKWQGPKEITFQVTYGNKIDCRCYKKLQSIAVCPVKCN